MADQDQWLLARGERDGFPMIIRMAAGYRGMGALPGYDHRIIVGANLRAPTPAGFPSTAEGDDLQRFEENLCTAVETDEESLCVLVITNQGIRDFIFYTRDPHTAKARIDAALPDLKGFRFEVGGASVSDSDVRENVSTKLRYDRVGYGIMFNNLGVDVNNGVVTIAGNVRDYADRDSALAIVSTTAGVKDVVDEIEVAPTSINDDRLRIQLARAIYGDTSLRKYAMDPQAPIRIIVENGHVELAGVVLNDMDRQLVATRANLVPGIFSVTNHLAVASQLKE